MNEENTDILYLCPSCFTPAENPGPCPNCGTEVREFCPGGASDTCRRPVINERGEVCTHVPLWWVRSVAPELAAFLEGERKESSGNG
jgi:hypothetical protein